MFTETVKKYPESFADVPRDVSAAIKSFVEDLRDSRSIDFASLPLEEDFLLRVDAGELTFADAETLFTMLAMASSAAKATVANSQLTGLAKSGFDAFTPKQLFCLVPSTDNLRNMVLWQHTHGRTLPLADDDNAEYLAERAVALANKALVSAVNEYEPLPRDATRRQLKEAARELQRQLHAEEAKLAEIRKKRRVQ